MTAPSSASSGGNGVYAYGGTNSAGLFPTNSFNANELLRRRGVSAAAGSIGVVECTPNFIRDGMDEITVGGSIVRVDLVSLSPTERDANNAPKRVFCQRLIFSIESFANSVEVMQNALQGLVDAGVIRRNQPRAPSNRRTSLHRPSTVR